MLPKPKFDLNSKPNTVNAVNTSVGSQSSQSWFQYNPNQSLNTNQHLTNGQSFNNYPNYNNYNQYYNYAPNLWANQNNYNSFSANCYNNTNTTDIGNRFNGNQFNNRNNNSFNHNYGTAYGQQSQRIDYQNKRFKNNNNFNNNKKTNSNGSQKTSFNCEACSRWFPTEELLNKHMSEHIVCGLDECPFRAHPKVIESHQRMQHFCFRDRTLVKKFMGLETMEDIEKWRTDRKKNFPTKENIVKKNELKVKERLEAIEEKKKLMEIKQKERELGEQLPKEQDISNEQKSGKVDKRKKNKKVFKNQSKRQPSMDTNERKLTLFQKLLLNDIQRNEEKDNENN